MRLKSISNVNKCGKTTFFTATMKAHTWWEKLTWKADKHFDCYVTRDHSCGWIHIDNGGHTYLEVEGSWSSARDAVKTYTRKHGVQDILDNMRNY